MKIDHANAEKLKNFGIIVAPPLKNDTLMWKDVIGDDPLFKERSFVEMHLPLDVPGGCTFDEFTKDTRVERVGDGGGGGDDDDNNDGVRITFTPLTPSSSGNVIIDETTQDSTPTATALTISSLSVPELLEGEESGGDREHPNAGPWRGVNSPEVRRKARERREIPRYNIMLSSNCFDEQIRALKVQFDAVPDTSREGSKLANNFAIFRFGRINKKVLNSVGNSPVAAIAKQHASKVARNKHGEKFLRKCSTPTRARTRRATAELNAQ